MSFTDRDLKDALAPLAGDPRALAAKVLAALPETPPLDPPRPRFPFGPVLLALALGAVLGFGAARFLTDPAPAKKEPTAPSAAPDFEVLAVVGELGSYGNQKNLDRLQRGDVASVGAWLEAARDSSAAVRVGPGIELYFDERSGCRIDGRGKLFAKEGRFAITMSTPGALEVQLGGTAVVTTNEADFVLATGSSGIELTVLRGVATLLVGKESRGVKAGTMCR